MKTIKTTLNIKMDNKIKQKAQKLAKAFGTSLNAVVIQYIKNFIKKNGFKNYKS